MEKFQEIDIKSNDDPLEKNEKTQININMNNNNLIKENLVLNVPIIPNKAQETECIYIVF